jgi:hypothetical protein
MSPTKTAWWPDAVTNTYVQLDIFYQLEGVQLEIMQLESVQLGKVGQL